MTARRVLHLPRHLHYVQKLQLPGFATTAAPVEQPLTVGRLVRVPDWSFFEVLHLHSVELAAEAETRRLVERVQLEGKALVFTAHDLLPNIEPDGAAFERKMRIIVHAAHTVVTLTRVAGVELTNRFDITPRRLHCLPHGAAAEPPVSTARTPGILAFGALRPNRHFGALVRAWRTLPPSRRPPLRLLLRSLSPADGTRDADLLDELHRAREVEPDLTVATTAGMVPQASLTEWCLRGSVLALPYGRITHSGQLELARDLGLVAVAPDVPTLRAQVECAEGDDAVPVVWTPVGALSTPDEYAASLMCAIGVARRHSFDSARWRDFRKREHQQLLDALGAIYTTALAAAEC